MGQCLGFWSNLFLIYSCVLQFFAHDFTKHRSLGQSLLSGKFPSKDQLGNWLRNPRGDKAGQLIAGGWRGAFESWCGDWKERWMSHQFIKRNYLSTMLCDQCSAINPHARTPEHLLEYIYSNFSVDAPWRRTLRSHQQYLEETPENLRTPWLAVPGFSISRVRWDTAHTILMGTGKDIAASFLWDLAPWNDITIICLYVTYFVWMVDTNQ